MGFPNPCAEKKGMTKKLSQSCAFSFSFVSQHTTTMMALTWQVNCLNDITDKL